MYKLKIIILFMVTGTIISLNPNQGKAQANTDSGGNFGIGAMFGEPTGISVKSWNNRVTAFDIGAAWSLSGRTEAIHMHGDLLFHSWFSDVQDERLAFYYGIGGRIIFSDDPDAGIRFPLGLNFVFQGAPFDIFVEAVPILDLTPDTEFAGNGAVGIRYYF